MTSRWRIELFGGLRVLRDEQVISRFRTQKTGALLAYLAYHPGQVHSREVLADRLWPECAPGPARNNLRVALASLRRQLEPPEPTASAVHAGGVLLADRTRVGLNEHAVETDVGEFESLLRDAFAQPDKGGQTGRANRYAMLTRAIDLYRGPLLTGYYEDWIPLEEQRLELLYFRALDTLVDWLQHEGQWDRALQYVQRGLRIDPDRERTQRSFAALRDRVGTVAPDAPDVVAGPAAGRGDLKSPPLLAAAAGDWPPLASKSFHLPLPLTRYFGRETEIEDLRELLSDPQVRLISLTGPGGSGKTRLTLEVLRRAAAECDGTLHFVPLASLSEPDLILDAVLDTLDWPRSPTAPVLEQIVAALVAAPAFMVLDNLEQLLPAGAGAVQALIAGVPHLTLLVTTRQRLDLDGEREWPVAPLTPPMMDSSAGLSSNDSLQAVARFASVQLFVNRAQVARPDFQLTRQNVLSVTRLLQRLEGLPLAIELVAARASVLAPAQMLAYLEASVPDGNADTVAVRSSAYLNLLQSHQKHWPQRQRALRATIGWSYGLLPPALQQFFARLWVLRGSFRLEAALEVCAEPQALHYLAQLRSASLIAAAEGALGSASSEMRFRLLEPIREFAGEQLSADEMLSLQERHAHCFLQITEQAERAFTGPDQLAWLARLEASADNFRAALTWSLAHQPRTALAIAANLAPFWQIRNHMSEGRNWIERALGRIAAGAETLPDDAALASLRAKALFGAGRLAFYAGDFPAAHTQLEAGIALGRQLDASRHLAAALHTLGHMELNEGSPDTALSHCQESLDISRSLDDQPLLVENLRTIAAIYTGQARYAEARDPLDECLALIRTLDDKLALAHTLDLAAFVSIGLGDSDAARQSWQASLATAREVQDGYLIGKTLWGLGTIVRGAGDLTAARGFLGEAMRVSVETDNQWMRPFMLEAVAYLAVEQSQATVAAQLLGASDAIRTELGSPLLPIFLPDYEHYLARIHAALDAVAFDAAWAYGRVLTFAQAAALAQDCCQS